VPTATAGQLRSELESARRCVDQLRREKAEEASRARQQTDTALRQLAERLRDERLRVIEQVIPLFLSSHAHTHPFNGPFSGLPG